MKHETKYQGWTNYETWAVALWLNDMEPSYRHWQEATRDAWRQAETPNPPFTRSEQARIILAEQLKQKILDGVPEDTVTGLYADLLGAALDEVDWHEIAAHWLDDAELEGYQAA